MWHSAPLLISCQQNVTRARWWSLRYVTLPCDQWEDRAPDNWPIRVLPRIIIVSSQLLMIILSIKYLGIFGWQYAIGPASPSCKDQNSLYLCHSSSWLGITRGARCSRETQRIQEDFKMSIERIRCDVIAASSWKWGRVCLNVLEGTCCFNCITIAECFIILSSHRIISIN